MEQFDLIYFFLFWAGCFDSGWLSKRSPAIWRARAIAPARPVDDVVACAGGDGRDKPEYSLPERVLGVSHVTVFGVLVGVLSELESVEGLFTTVISLSEFSFELSLSEFSLESESEKSDV
jgi:hypothetical protein